VHSADFVLDGELFPGEEGQHEDRNCGQAAEEDGALAHGRAIIRRQPGWCLSRGGRHGSLLPSCLALALLTRTGYLPLRCRPTSMQKLVSRLAYTVFGLVFTGSGSLCFYALYHGIFQAGKAGQPLKDTVMGIGALLVIGGGHFWIGLIILGALLGGIRADGFSRRMKLQHPDEPWLWHRKWLRGTVPEGSPMYVAVPGGCLLGSLGFLMGGFFLYTGVVERKWGLFVGALLLLPIGVVGFCGTLYVLAQRRLKFGRSVLALETIPAVPRGELRGKIHVPRRLAQGQFVTIILRCSYRYPSGKGKPRDVVLWESSPSESQAIAQESGEGCAVPVRISLPEDARETATAKEGAVEWQVRAKARLPGIDYAAEFEVPVFRRSHPSG
jgi:hypothetical protein